MAGDGTGENLVGYKANVCAVKGWVNFIVAI